jgi:hypothetical protein
LFCAPHFRRITQKQKKKKIDIAILTTLFLHIHSATFGEAWSRRSFSGTVAPAADDAFCPSRDGKR